MRQFDTLQSYLDNDGNPLVGRARFCDESGRLKRVMDVFGKTADSVVFTDASGRMSRQVFLEDSDYVVFFDRYDGDANPYTDDDEHSWNNQFSVKSLYDTFNISVDTDGEQCVSTMRDLRSLNPDTIKMNGDGSRIVKLLGYNSAGDKESVDYVYDGEDSSSEDDGGSVIQPDGVDRGRWKLIYGEGVLDVRHFGAFPSLTATIDMFQNGCIRNADAYAKSYGLGIFFPSVGNNVYYDISMLTLSNVSSSNKSRMFCKSGENTEANVNGVESAYFHSSDSAGIGGRINVVSEVLRTSFNPGNSKNVLLKPSSRLIMDTDYIPMMSFKDVDVYIVQDQTSPQAFTRCTFSGDGKFQGNVNRKFYNCEIRETLFGDDYDYELTEFHDCYSSVRLWSSADGYANFCMKNKSVVIDLEGNDVERLHVGWSCSISNGSIGDLLVEADGEVIDINIDNVSFSIRKNSRMDSLSVNNVVAKGNYNIYCEKLVAVSSTFSCSVVSGHTMSFTSYFKYLMTRTCNISNCEFGPSLVLSATEGIVSNVNVMNCTFSNNGNINVFEFDSHTGPVVINNSAFGNNVIVGTTRELITSSLDLDFSDTCYIMGNVNASVSEEKSSAKINVFNNIFVKESCILNKASIALSGVHYGYDFERDTANLDIDGNVYFLYQRYFDPNKEEYVIDVSKGAKMFIRIEGKWLEVSKQT